MEDASNAFLVNLAMSVGIVVIVLVLITVASFAGFKQVKQQFFPDSNTPLFSVHYKLPQGADITRTSTDLQLVEQWLSKREDVVSVTAIVGDGASRFMLTYPVQRPNPSYGQLIVRTHTIDDIPALQEALEEFGTSQLIDGEFRTKRLVFGPGGGDPIQLRISGPDPRVLRELGAEAATVMRANSAEFTGMRTDWREQELVIKSDYATERAQTAGVTREDIARTLRFATDGVAAGIYRDDERLQVQTSCAGRGYDHPGHGSIAGRRIFVSMAVTIMAGQAFGSVLTLIAAPVLYYVFFRRDEKRQPPGTSTTPA